MKKFFGIILISICFLLILSGCDKNKVKERINLFVGVNGVGKTTSIAKIANKLKKDNKKVMVIAGDTFRAGAVNQLKEWADKLDLLFFGDDRKDPSAVIYDGLLKAKEKKVEYGIK